MTKTRKALALLLALSLVAALFAGCGSTPASSKAPDASQAPAESGGEPADTGDTVTFTMMYNDNSSYPFDQNWPAIQKIQEEKNVKLDLQAVPAADYEAKVRIQMNSGNIPDIVPYFNSVLYSEFQSSGLLLNIDEHKDKFPSLYASIDAFDIADEVENWRTQDGDLLCLPRMDEGFMYNTGPSIRLDVLEELGMEAPTNYDELYTFLRAYKDKYPDSYPMANHGGSSAEANIRSISGACWGLDNNNNGFIYDREKNEYFYGNTTENYKEYVTFYNKLMSEGLADPELYTASMDQWKQKMVNGDSVFCFTWVSELNQVNADGKTIVGEDFDLQPLAPIEGPGGKWHRIAGRIYFSTIIPASAADGENFDRLCDLVDWMSYGDGVVYTTWGIEGETWEEKDGQKVFTDMVLEADSIQGTLWKYGASNDNFTKVFPYDWFSKVLNSPTMEELTAEAKAEGWFPPAARPPKTDPDSKEEETMLLASVVDYEKQMHEQFVFGKTSIEDGWDNYVAEMESKGVTKLLEMYNASLK